MIRLSLIFPGLSCVFREVPSVTPGALIGAKLLWRVRGCDLMRGCRQSFAFGRVLPLSRDGAFWFVVHDEPLSAFYSAVTRDARDAADPPNPLTEHSPRAAFFQVVCNLNVRGRLLSTQAIDKRVSLLGEK